MLDASVVDDGDPVGDRHRLALIMRDVEDRDAEPIVERLQLRLHVLAQLAVERAEGLVEEEDGRIEYERARQCDALLLPPLSWLGRRLSNPTS